MKRGVLVVDDDPFIRKLVATTLEDVSEFQLFEAGDGIQAIEVAERELPTIVFLDVDMPRMDGIATCRRAAQQPGDERRHHRDAHRRHTGTGSRPRPRRPVPTCS